LFSDKKVTKETDSRERLDLAPLGSYSPLRIPLVSVAPKYGRAKIGTSSPSLSGFRPNDTGGVVFRRGRLVKSPLLNRFFSLFLAETRNRAPGRAVCHRWHLVHGAIGIVTQAETAR